jgi:putative ABC transport system permease protein
MNFQSFSQIAFAFRVTPALLATAMIYALIMGLFGGMLPAIQRRSLAGGHRAAAT